RRKAGFVAGRAAFPFYQAQPAALALAIFAPGDAEQPGAERPPKIGTRIEPADMLPGKDKGVLRQIVGIGRVAAKPPQKGAQGLLVHPDQPPEGGSRTGLGVSHPGRFGAVLAHRLSLSSGGQPRGMNSSERKLLMARAAKIIIG